MPDPAVAAARALADEVLRPAAEEVDRTSVRPASLRAIGAAGLLGVTAPVEVGGGGRPAGVRREVDELLAGADGSTWFVTAQHATPLQALLASANEGLRARWLPGLAGGSALAGVAFSHLRRPGPPPVSATRVPGGWRVDGRVDWTTGWGLVDVLLLGAATPDGELVFALLPATARPGLRPSAPLELAAMQATQTVALALEGLVVADADVALVLDAEDWREEDRARTSNAGPHVFGLLAEAVRRLREGRREPASLEVADAVERAAEDLRARAYRLVDEVPAGERLEERTALRVEALLLGVRATAALVAAGSGRAMARDAAPQRLAREALFHLVQAQTPPVRGATLSALAATTPTPSPERLAAR